MTDKMVAIIPTSGRPLLLHRTLRSLAECRRPNIYRGTVVVENGGRKEAEQTAREFEQTLDLRYVYLRIGNKSNALNTILETLDNTLIFFADDDVRFDPGALEAYAEAASEKSHGEFYGGPFAADYVQKPPEWLMEFLPKSAVGWNLGNESRYIQKGDVFIGFNWAAFSNDLKRLGGFSVNHGPGSKTGAVGQETEMQGRLLSSGVKGVYVPNAVVWHYVPPERCSRKFAATRAYRWGIQGGLGKQGPIVSLLRRWAASGVRSLLSAGNKNPKASFEPYYRFLYNTGMLRGRLASLSGKKSGLS